MVKPYMLLQWRILVDAVWWQNKPMGWKEENVWFRSGKFLRAVMVSWARLGSALLHWEHVPSDADCCAECSESS